MLDALMVHSRLKHMIYWWSVPHGPLGFVEKPGLTALTLICHQSKEDKFGQSTNGLLDPWGRCHKIYTATDITDFVSNVSICIPLFPPWCWYPHFRLAPYLLWQASCIPHYYDPSEYVMEAWDDTYLHVSILILGISLDHGRRSGIAPGCDCFDLFFLACMVVVLS